MKTKKKVMVAMSGGVDSSVAAALLKEKGYEVIGLTMCFNLPDAKSGKPSCCGAQGIGDAKRVADILAIKHYVLNFSKELQERVIADFIKQYSQGLTPNPCVRCNEFIKFEGLLKKAVGLGMDYLATGHYARIVKVQNKYFLKKAKDKKKDQSYFLYRLTQDKLRRILFPLGELTKDKVRKLAKRFKLPIADKKESQEICFVPGTYQDFLKKNLKGSFSPGPVVDTMGKQLGMHQGIPFYTIGQRHGLGIAAKTPLYVTAIDRQANTVKVGPKEEVLQKTYILDEVMFISGIIKELFRCRVKIRYLHREAQATVIPDGNRATVVFDRPQFAITPGQSAVFYKRQVVLGGGIISTMLS